MLTKAQLIERWELSAKAERVEIAADEMRELLQYGITRFEAREYLDQYSSDYGITQYNWREFLENFIKVLDLDLLPQPPKGEDNG